MTEVKSRIVFGGDYFPEQWPEQIIQEDIRLMKQANVNMVSLAIFAWDLLQPDEDTFTFEWLDKIMDTLADNDIDVCLGTSTAAPPSWLIQKYDDILFVNEFGQRIAPGSRQCYCVNSPSYRKAARRLAGELATHYKGHKALKIWHINNEYANKNSMCFCERCEQKFREWLKKKYKNLNNLNECWGTVFWSEKYFSWDQINAPRASSGGRNPTKLLDYKRFLSESFLSLYLEEYNIIKQITPDIPVTTNFEGDWSKFDHFQFKDVLDIVSWNCYPNPADPNSAQWAAMRDSMMRSLLDKPFMLMEQAPSQVDWYPVNISKRPGLMRLWSYQAIANGSDSVMFFQWRASKKGVEKYHSGMVPHYGPESRIFKEICTLGEELKKIKDVAGATIKAEVAILMDSDSWWLIDDPFSSTKSLDNESFWKSNRQPFPTVLVSYIGQLEYYFSTLHKLHIPVDIIPPTGYDFSKYKVIVAPLLHMIKPGFKEAIEKFVKNGGTFITTYLTGFVDEYVSIFDGGYPGPLSDVVGLKVEEYTPLSTGSNNTIKIVDRRPNLKGKYKCTIWCDIVHTTTARTIAVFGEDYYANSPAVTQNEFGSGKAYYIATQPDEQFMKGFFKNILAEQNIEIPELPEKIEYITRTKNNKIFHFYLNHSDNRVEIKLPPGKYIELLTEKQCKTSMSLDGYGVAVLKEDTD